MTGIVFSNIFDGQLGTLTEHRTMASLPYGGRYRLIDFVLTNMINSGISTVGVITKRNYQSLMDHVGNGNEWDLDRKTGGLFILPPFSAGQKSMYKGKLEALQGAEIFLKRAGNDYVVLSDSNAILRVDYRDMQKKHVESGADITVLTKTYSELSFKVRPDLMIKCGSDDRVCNVRIKPSIADADDKIGLGVYIMSRELLLKLIDDARAYSLYDFERECIQRQKDNLKFFAYNFEGRAIIIDNVRNYYKGNMELLNVDIHNELFCKNGPVYTKTRDEVPSRYYDDAEISDSLIADGCVINGRVENSILSRGVVVKKGAKVINSIVMQDSVIGKDVEIKNAILDKEVSISDNKKVAGDIEYPFILKKGTSI